MLLPGVPSAHWGHTWLLHHKDLRQSARIRALFKHLSALEEKPRRLLFALQEKLLSALQEKPRWLLFSLQEKPQLGEIWM